MGKSTFSALEITGDSEIVDDDSGALLKAGGTTAATALVNDTAGTIFCNLRFDCGATSGDARGIYDRLYITGAGGGGEALRAFTTVDDVAGATAHGAHISLNFDATGTLTGLGAAIRGTLHVPNDASQAGTLTAIQAEIYADGATSDTAGATYSFFRVVNGGNATGMGNIDDDAYLFHFAGATAGSGNTVGALGNEPTWTSKTRLIKCKLDGVGDTYLVAIDL